MIDISWRCFGSVVVGEALSSSSLVERTIELTGVLSSCVMLLTKLVRCVAKLTYFSNTARAENPSSRTIIVEMKLGRARRKTSARVGDRSSDTRI